MNWIRDGIGDAGDGGESGTKERDRGQLDVVNTGYCIKLELPPQFGEIEGV